MRIDINNDVVLSMIEDLRANTGAANCTEVIRAAINLYHKKTFPNYSPGGRPDPLVVMNERKVKRLVTKEAVRDADKMDKLRAGRELCEMLGGRSVQTPGGGWVCQYNTFDKLNKHEVSIGTAEIPLLALTESHLELQYKNGTRDEIKEIMDNKKQ